MTSPSWWPCTSTRGWRAYRPCRRSRGSTALPRQGRHLCAGLCQRPRRDPGCLCPLLPHGRTAAVSDPNVIHDLQSKLDAHRIYTPSEVEPLPARTLIPRASRRSCRPTWRRRSTASASGCVPGPGGRQPHRAGRLEIFRKDLGSFVRAYEFLSQIFPYDDTDLEKQHVFYKHLLPWLKRQQRGGAARPFRGGTDPLSPAGPGQARAST